MEKSQCTTTVNGTAAAILPRLTHSIALCLAERREAFPSPRTPTPGPPYGSFSTYCAKPTAHYWTLKTHLLRLLSQFLLLSSDRTGSVHRLPLTITTIESTSRGKSARTMESLTGKRSFSESRRRVPDLRNSGP